jgi:Tfp pilus assembly protein PilE
MKSTLKEAKAALTKLKNDKTRYYNQKQTKAPETNWETRSTLMPVTFKPIGHPRKCLI